MSSKFETTYLFLQEIFDIQYQLNLKFLESIGQSYPLIVTCAVAEPQKLVWIENYMKAYTNELQEIVQASEPEMKEEIIDGLHFLVSLSQVLNIPLSNIAEVIEKREQLQLFKNWIAFDSFMEIEKLRRQLPWKWWKDYSVSIFDFDAVTQHVLVLWSKWFQFCLLCNMEFMEVYVPYIKKVTLNYQRLETETINGMNNAYIHSMGEEFHE